MKKILLSLSCGALLCTGLTSCDAYLADSYAVGRPYGYYSRPYYSGLSLYSSRSYYHPTSYYGYGSGFYGNRYAYPSRYYGGSYYGSRYLSPTRYYSSPHRHSTYGAPSTRVLRAPQTVRSTNVRYNAGARLQAAEEQARAGMASGFRFR